MNRIYKATTLIAIAAVAMPLLLSPVYAITWSSFINVSNTSGTFSGETSYDFDSSGSIHGLFYDFLDANLGIYYFNNVGGTWTKSVLVWGAKYPRFCITPSDQVMHAFYRYNNAIYEITKPVSGGSWSAPVELTGSTNHEGMPIDCIVDANGGIYVVWWHLFDASMSPNRSAVWGRYKPYGGSWGATELIKGTDDPNKFPMEVHLATYAGKIYCTYQYDGEMYYKVRETNGTWGTSKQIPYDGAISALGFSNTGEMAMFYARNCKEHDGLDYRTFCCISYDQGATWGPEIPISGENYLSRAPMGLTYDNYGNLHLAYQRCNYDGQPFDMYYGGRVSGVWQPTSNITNSSGRTGAASYGSLKVYGDTLWFAFTDNTWSSGYEEVYFTSAYVGLPSNSGTLRGTVVNANTGAPVAGATVSTSTGGYNAVTDANGNYVIWGMPVGTYNVTAAKQWFDPSTVNNVSIYNTQTTVVNFSLAPDAIPPGAIQRFCATAHNTKVNLCWINATDEDVKGVMIRYKTTGYPTSTTDGTLVANVEGGPGATGLYEHKGCTNGVTYYYSAWTYDQQNNYSTTAKQMSAMPNTPPYANKLTNGTIGTGFTNGVANGWTAYRTNDPANALYFSSDDSQYVTKPAQQIASIDSPLLPDPGYTMGGIRQSVATTQGKVYMLTGWQDFYNDSYSANSTMYCHCFGMDPFGETTTGEPSANVTLGGVQWLAPGMSFWNKSKGGSPYYAGMHRVTSAYTAGGTSMSIWSGLITRNDKTPDARPTKFNTDELYLAEIDFPANSTGTLWNGTFESATDYQNGDILPDNWLPAGGSIGYIDVMDCLVYGARSGNRGLRIWSRRGCCSRGVMQKLATSPGTAITFSCYACTNATDAEIGVGIDPQGGSDINSPSIVWTTSVSTSWTQLTVNAIAAGSYATLFLRAKTTSPSTYDASRAVFFDDASATWTVASASRGMIIGRIKDTFGNPLIGATVSTTSGGYSCTTGTGGVYCLGGVAPGTYSVVGGNTSYYSQTKANISVTADGTTVCHFDLTPMPGTISGVVYDTLGATVPGATVSTSTGGYTTTSNASGAYTLSNVAAGTYSVTASKTDYGPDTESNVTVGPAANVIVNFNLIPPPGTISGWVRDQCGAGVSGATVSTTTGGYSTTTNSSGNYTLTNVSPATYSVVATKSGCSTTTQSNVVVTSYNNTVANLTINRYDWTEKLANGNFEGGFFGFWGGKMANSWGATFDNSASGASWDSYNFGGGNGYVQKIFTGNTSTEVGIAQSIAGLTAGNPYKFSGYAYHTQAGYVTKMYVDETNSVPSGTVPTNGQAFATTVGVWEYQEVSGTVPASGQVTVYVWTDQQSGEDGAVYLDNMSFQMGTLAACSNGNIAGSVVDNLGIPLVGATVSTTTGGYSGSTASDGTYAIYGVAPSTYSVTATMPGYASQTKTGQVVTAGSTTTVNFTLSPTTGSISGTVKDSSGVGISGATVTTNTGDYVGTTDSSGGYTISGVAPGTYNVTAGKAGYNSSTLSNQVVSSNQTTTCNFTLTTAQGAISGIVRDSCNNGLSGATVSTTSGGYTTTSVAGGGYTLSNVLAGTYSVVASKSGYETKTNTGVVVTAGNTTNSNFTIAALSQQEKLVNRDFSTGFFSFWGGAIGNNWEAGFTNSASGATWASYNVGGSYGNAQKITVTNTTTLAGIYQRVTGLTPGEQYTFSAEVFQQYVGYTVYMAVDPTNSLATGVLPSSGTAFPVVAGQWNTQSVSGTVGSGGAVAVYIWVDKVSGSDGYVYIDNTSLKVGSPTSCGGTISGTVKDDSGAGLSGATVSTTTGGYSTTTGSGGGYTLSNVTAGTYSVVATKSGYTTSTLTNQTVTAGQTTTCNFTISNKGTISGNVKDAAGANLSGATVSTTTGGYTTTTNSSGNYTLSNVVAGDYTVTSAKTGYQSQSKTTTVTAGSTATVNFTLSSSPSEKVANGNMEGGFFSTGWGTNCSGQTSKLPNSWGWNNESGYPFNTFDATSVKHGGSHSLGFAFCQTASSPGKMGIAYQSVNLGSAGATGTFTVWAYHTDGNCPSIMCWNPGQNQNNPYTAQSAGRYQWVTTDNWGQRNTWVTRSMTVTADSSGYVTIMVGGAAHPGTASGAKLYIDDVSVQ